MTIRPTSLEKRRAVLAAAEEEFLSGGYDTVSMDRIAARSGVAKQTLYAHFGSKEGLFLQLVTAMTEETGDRVHADPLAVTSAGDLPDALHRLLSRQLDLVLTPRLMQLRRLVIGELGRFPDLARTLAERGPHRAIDILADVLADLDARGLLAVPHPGQAASQLNWLVMGQPVNDAMLLGDASIPSAAERDSHVRAAVRTFLAAYGT
ncbi:TetR/AcrR family transcriptional regulator [Demequina flava]|uniref:TetR/AcrR family transcriptional regulator n=1 Tax=Demequina flava TaxID=1095025 RepID=UPI000782B9FE|nr:TetR/AcrR family transcriptional regulator [Demequina flava]